MLLNHKDLTLQDSDLVTSALEHFRKRRALGFSDCLVFEIARKTGHLPLGTFDRNLAKLSGVEHLKELHLP
jgi:predicted nucleic-acid-binding protein